MLPCVTHKVEQTVAVALAVAMVSLGLGFVYWFVQSASNAAPDCTLSCLGTEAAEPISSVAPEDGLQALGARLPVWNFHHRLVDPDSWGQEPQGYYPADNTDKNDAADEVVVVLAGDQRVTTLQISYQPNVSPRQAAAQARHELPTDAAVVHPAVAETRSGCVDSTLYRSRLLTRVFGNVLIRAALRADLTSGRTDQINWVDVDIVPSQHPCEIA